MIEDIHMNWHMIRWGTGLLGTGLVPIACCTLYLEMTRPFPQGTAYGLDTDWLIVIGCISLGVISILQIPCGKLYRIFALIIYVPVFGWVLLTYWLVYEMVRSGVWL
jgi:hypothetical protein